MAENIFIEPVEETTDKKVKKHSLFYRLREKIYDTLEVYKQIKRDKKEEEEFTEKLQDYSSLPGSQFSLYELHASDDMKYISTIITLPEEYRNMPDYYKFNKLNEICGFYTNYMRQKDVLGLCVSNPEYLHIEDPNLPDYIDSLTYAAYWYFEPQVPEEKKKKYIRGRNWFFSALGAAAVAIPLLIIFL